MKLKTMEDSCEQTNNHPEVDRAGRMVTDGQRYLQTQCQCHVGVDGSFCKNPHEKFRPMIIHEIRRRGNNDDTNAFVCVV